MKTFWRVSMTSMLLFTAMTPQLFAAENSATTTQPEVAPSSILKVHNLSVSQIEDTVQITLELDTELKNGQVFIHYVDPQHGYFEKVYLEKRNDVYNGTFKVTDQTSPGDWKVDSIYFTNQNGLILASVFHNLARHNNTADLSGGNFRVSNAYIGPKIDWESLQVSKSSTSAGDILKITVDIAETNGIQSGFLEYHHTKTGQTYRMTLLKNKQTGYYEARLQVSPEMAYGEWQLYGIEATDNNYNKSYVFHDPAATDAIFANLSHGNFNVKPLLVYTTHVQKYGWQGYVKEGKVNGTEGEALRLEALKIDFAGEIQYRTHVQKYGWLDWVGNGELSGTVGESKRMEAIELRLAGELANKYDLYYRVHVQNFGWLDWAKNGASAGTAGYGYRMEAIEIRLVEKGGPAPGRTITSFRERTR